MLSRLHVAAATVGLQQGGKAIMPRLWPLTNHAGQHLCPSCQLYELLPHSSSSPLLPALLHVAQLLLLLQRPASLLLQAVNWTQSVKSHCICCRHCTTPTTAAHQAKCWTGRLVLCFLQVRMLSQAWWSAAIVLLLRSYQPITLGGTSCS